MAESIDARVIPEGTVVASDVCIVGAGAAGIALARELAGEPFEVCLMESGGFDFEQATQSLYKADNVGLPYFPLDANRQRSFGGTTNLWAGWCRPLDEIDFRPRPWVPHSGWPISRADLTSYYRRAHEVCGLGPFEYDPDCWQRRTGGQQLPLETDRVVTKVYRLATATRLGKIFRQPLASAANVRILHHANLLEVETTENGGRASRLRVGCLAGNRFLVVARFYVLAAGGIENARLLLLSSSVHPRGLGNQNDLVGRYFMEHLHSPSGRIDLANPRRTAPGLYCSVRQPAIARLFFPESVQEREGLLNYSVMLQPVYWGDRSKLAVGLTRLIGTAAQWRLRGDPLKANIARCLTEEGFSLLSFFPLFRLGRPLRGFRLHHTLEQAPNADSRITLSAERDALGLNRVRLNWRTSTLEPLTFRRAPALVGEAFQQAGLGRLVLESAPQEHDWPPPPLQGLRGHHMGTTRMSRDPRHGVVDDCCRLHGTENVFIAGSSVFPTAGAGTPTLTIIALALRLADHLKQLMRDGA